MVAHDPPFGRTVGVHRTSWRIQFPRHASGTVLVLGFRGAWVSHTAPRGLKQRRPCYAPGHIWPGHLHGRDGLSARVMDTGFPIVVWRSCLGLGFTVTQPLFFFFLKHSSIVTAVMSSGGQPNIHCVTHIPEAWVSGLSGRGHCGCGAVQGSKLYYIADITEVAAPYSRPGGTGRSTGGTVWVGCCPRDCTHHA